MVPALCSILRASLADTMSDIKGRKNRNRRGSKSKKKKKSSDGNDVVEDSLSLDEENLYLLKQMESLKHRLMVQTNRSSAEEAVVRELRARLVDLNKDYDSEKQRTFEIAADMTRQYKAMREFYIKKETELQNAIIDFKDQLELAKLASEELERKKKQELALKDAEITEQRNKMDEMAQEFGQMLKNTLEKMSDNIVISTEHDKKGV